MIHSACLATNYLQHLQCQLSNTTFSQHAEYLKYLVLNREGPRNLYHKSRQDVFFCEKRTTQKYFRKARQAKTQVVDILSEIWLLEGHAHMLHGSELPKNLLCSNIVSCLQKKKKKYSCMFAPGRQSCPSSSAFLQEQTCKQVSRKGRLIAISRPVQSGTAMRFFQEWLIVSKVNFRRHKTNHDQRRTGRNECCLTRCCIYQSHQIQAQL